MYQTSSIQHPAVSVPFTESFTDRDQVYYRIHPAVYGWLGENCVPSVKSQTTDYNNVHLVIVDYPADCISKSLAVYVSNDRLAARIQEEAATGVELQELEVTFSKQYPNQATDQCSSSAPQLHWLKITGRAGIDDFGLCEKMHNALVVSERILEIMIEEGLNECDYTVHGTDCETNMLQKPTRCIVDLSGALID